MAHVDIDVSTKSKCNYHIKLLITPAHAIENVSP